MKARVLIDRYHHRPACEWISDHALTGRFANNLGRYGLTDNYHTNGYFNLEFILADQCRMSEHASPITPDDLVGCDVLLIVNPDYQNYHSPQPGPRFDSREIAAIHEFVARGGSLVMMLNSFLAREGEYPWKENYNLEDANLILEPYGIAGLPHVSRDSEWCMTEEGDPLFGRTVRRVEYGHGGQLQLRPAPGVRQRVHFGNEGRIYCASACRESSADGIVFVLADAGFISNGLITVPWIDNLEATRSVFQRLRPSWLSDAGPLAYVSFDFRVIGYPHAARLGRDQFTQLNPNATFQELYNYHYLSQCRRSRHGVGDLPLSVDPADVAAGQVALLRTPLLGCEMFADRMSIDIPLKVVALQDDDDERCVKVVGHAPLPQMSLSKSCNTILPDFAAEQVAGGIQSLVWHYRMNRRSKRLISSRIATFAEPAWTDDTGAFRSLVFGRTASIAPFASP